jgi:hypothetical protein
VLDQLLEAAAAFLAPEAEPAGSQA